MSARRAPNGEVFFWALALEYLAGCRRPPVGHPDVLSAAAIITLHELASTTGSWKLLRALIAACAGRELPAPAAAA